MPRVRVSISSRCEREQATSDMMKWSNGIAVLIVAPSLLLHDLL